jgi:N-acetylmuramoyl-L-alanine amidase CwlA
MFDRTYTTTKTTKRTKPIEYIVIHSTAMPTTDASGVAKAFANTTKDKSTHYVVDEHSCYHLVSDDAKYYTWHCGSKSYRPGCSARNANSIGVDLCDRGFAGVNLNSVTDPKWYFPYSTLHNAIAVLTYLCSTYHLTADKIVRHYEVTGKHCPICMTQDNRQFLFDWLKEEVGRNLASLARLDNALDLCCKL